MQNLINKSNYAFIKNILNILYLIIMDNLKRNKTLVIKKEKN